MSAKEPKLVELEEGKRYQWCACGQSKEQPFCDGGSHMGSGKSPKMFKCLKGGKQALCMCKKTKTPPYCDGSHSK